MTLGGRRLAKKGSAFRGQAASVRQSFRSVGRLATDSVSSYYLNSRVKKTRIYFKMKYICLYALSKTNVRFRQPPGNL